MTSADGGQRPCRVAVINTHPIQYFAPLYAYLNQADDIDIIALYLSDFSLRGALDRGFGQAVTWDVDLMAGYSAKFVGRNFRTIEPYGFFAAIGPALIGEISRKRYDVVWIHGHGYAALVLAFLVAKLKGVPVFMRGETHLGLPRGGWKMRLRKSLIGTLYRHCAGLLAIGTANRLFYRAMGVPEERISTVPYTVDNQRFIAAAQIDAAERSTMRKRLGVEGNAPIILYASKFQRRKRPDNLLKAFGKLRERGVDADLVMVGSGEMETELKAAAAGDPRIHFPGFFNQSDLPKVYAASEVFVLPSDEEPFGLIVNEVMCASLPVVVSEVVGCAPDLVQDGVNGATFAPHDVDMLADTLDRIVRDPELRARMGAESRRIIDHWSYRECLTGLREALAKAGIAHRASSSPSPAANMQTS